MRIAVLIISFPEGDRWQFEKSIWETYMNARDWVDCFFLEADGTLPKGSVQQSGNFLKIGCVDNIEEGIFKKTISALHHLGDSYDFFIRTNLSTFWRFDLLKEKLKQVGNDNPFYGGWAWRDFVGGFAIVLNREGKEHLVDEGLKQYDQQGRDDRLIGSIFNRDNNFIHVPLNEDCFYWEYEDLDLEKAIIKIRDEQKFIIRTLPHGDLHCQKQILEKLLFEFESI